MENKRAQARILACFFVCFFCMCVHFLPDIVAKGPSAFPK